MPGKYSPAGIDVFVSYAEENFAVAEQVVDAIEARGVTCWIARRDILPGDAYEAAIVRAIHSSRVMVVVWSDAASWSRHVQREVRTASEADLTILPLRIDQAPASEVFLYHLGGSQWFDAVSPPIAEHLKRLADALTRVLAAEVTDADVNHLGVPRTRSEDDSAARVPAGETLRGREEAEPKHESVIVTATVPYRHAERFSVAIGNRLPVLLAGHSGGESKEYTDLSLRFRLPIAASIVTAAVQKAAAELGGQVIAIIENPQPQPGVLSISGTVDIKADRRAASDGSSNRLDAQELDALYEAYWTEFSVLVERSDLRLRPPTPRASNYARFSLGSSDRWMHAFASVRDRYIGVELILRQPRYTSAYDTLKQAQVQVEHEFGSKLQWNELQGSYRIALVERGFDLRNHADWPGQHDWLIKTVKGFQQILLKRIEPL
jgi:hypothetical protein